MSFVMRLALLGLGLLLASCSDSNNSNNSGFTPVAEQPVIAFTERQQAYIDYTVANPGGNAYASLTRLAAGETPDEAPINEALRKMQAREDTADFNLPSMLYILYRYADSQLLSDGLTQSIEDTILAYKYWPDELQTEADPIDTDDAVYWTENHFILFSAGAYLAGQLYPDQVFSASGETGVEKMDTFRPRIMRWLKLRYESGFSEWLSNVYYNEDIPALVALIEFAEDPEIVELSTMVLDLMIADMAINQFKGNFGATHGRTYEHKMSADRDSSGALFKMLFDLNKFSVGNYGATTLALSQNYRMPKVFYDIANDSNAPEVESRQRMGIKLEEAANWGLDLNALEDGMTFLTMEAYAHPLVTESFYQMLNAYKWWEHSSFEDFKSFKSALDEGPATRKLLASTYEKDVTRNMRPEVNIYTYRTPDYMLSTAQDWRKGFGGDQQSIWQATLGTDAVSFTTHPASKERSGLTPNYWTGYGTLPRSVQVKNVVVSLFHIDTSPAIYVTNNEFYTHAYLPRAKFDEIMKEGGWFFARKDNGYLALWSSDPEADWIANDNPKEQHRGDYDIIAQGIKSVWIVELGRAEDDGDFASFKQAILDANLSVDVDALSVTYQSPAQGDIVMNWDDPVTNNGGEVLTRDFPRYDSLYGRAEFPADKVKFSLGDEYLELDFTTRNRKVSSFLEE